MRTASARVLRGRVLEFDDEDECAIVEGVAEIRAGRYASVDELRRFLRRK